MIRPVRSPKGSVGRNPEAGIAPGPPNVGDLKASEGVATLRPRVLVMTQN
jgi:hypothetical protein